MEDSCRARLPLVPCGEAWRNKVLAADMTLLAEIKLLFLQQNFYAEEVIRRIDMLSRLTKTKAFFHQLLYRSLTMREEHELSSFLIDQCEGVCKEDIALSATTSTSILHLISQQRHPVVSLAEKVLLLNPDAGAMPDSRGETPLHTALQADSPCVPLVMLLLEHSPAAAEVLSNDKMLPIHMLFARNAQNPCLACLRLLLVSYPEGTLMMVKESFTSIVLGTPGALHRQQAWTVLSRLESLSRDHRPCVRAERGRGKRGCRCGVCCTHLDFLQAAQFAHRMLCDYGLGMRRRLSLHHSSAPPSFSYSGQKAVLVKVHEGPSQVLNKGTER